MRKGMEPISVEHGLHFERKTRGETQMNRNLFLLLSVVLTFGSFGKFAYAEGDVLNAMGGWQYRVSFENRCKRAERWVIGKPNGGMINKWFFIEPKGDLYVVNASTDCSNTTKLAILDPKYFADPKLLLTLDPAVGVWTYVKEGSSCFMSGCFNWVDAETFTINRVGQATAVFTYKETFRRYDGFSFPTVNSLYTFKYTYKAGKLYYTKGGVTQMISTVNVSGNKINYGGQHTLTRSR